MTYFAIDPDRLRAQSGGGPFPPWRAANVEPIDGRAGTLHDLRNLLAVIASGASIAGRADGADRDGILEAVQQAAFSADRLVSRLAGRGSVAAAGRTWPGVALARIAALARSRLPASIWLSVRIGPDLPALRADPELFDSALLNLVLNAEDAMPAGGRLTIRARRVPGGIAVTVADTGIGMSEEVLRRAGTPFFTTKPGKGSGLGLSQVSRFAARLGGSLSLRSRPGRGSVFRLHLPA